VLLLTACGSGNTPIAAVSSPSTAPTGTAVPSPSPAPKISLALVTLRGSNQLVVRDITDIAHPKTIGTLPAVSQPLLVDAGQMSYIDYDHGQLVRMRFDGSSKTTVTTSSQFTGYVDWSPDGSSVIYTTQTSDTEMALHQLQAGQDRVLGSIPAVPGVGCESVAGCPTDTWDVQLQYSRDGGYVSFVNSIIKPAFRLWSSDGKLLRSSDLKSEAMPVWSGRTLYFRDAKGVEMWRDGVVTLFLPGVQWIRPKASPAEGRIVYQVRDSQHWSHTYVVDTNTGHVRDLGKAHASPVFLTSRYIWYIGERACVPADGCGSLIAGVPSGKTYIYDLVTGTQSLSIIAYVHDVWPHAS
jgi:hypothetical protein